MGRPNLVGQIMARRGRRSAGVRRAAHLVLAAALAATLLGAVQLATSRAALADDVTASYDPLRTGWDPTEPGLSPSAVSGSSFGQLFSTAVDGQVYAQPLVIGNTVVVSTENNWIYGLDAASGAVRWSRSLGPAWPASTTGCADLVPNLGNTSTGVYDPATGTVYLTTKVDDGPDALHPNWYLHAVAASTGAERPGWPVKIVGTPSNDPDHPFVGYDVNQRPGLLLLNGTVYMAFGSQCDYGTYVGWVVGVNTTNQATNIWSDEAGASSKEAGIWHGGGGIMSDGPGRFFVTTGNGVTAPDGPGDNPPKQLSQSVVRLGAAADGTISAKDFFSPSNAATLDRNDQDLGSGGPVALPSRYFGTVDTPNLMVQIGKDGRLFLLNRDHLGGKSQGPAGTDDVVQTLGPYQGVWGHPAVYGGEGGYVYAVQNSNSMLAFKYGRDGQGRPALSLAGNTSEWFGYTAGSPIVTSDDTTPGSAVVWVVNVDGPTGANGRLCAYNAVPVGNHINLLRCFPIGTAVKFTTPASSNGRVYVGTRDGRVFGFGQPVGTALTAPQTNFGDVAVGQTGTGTVTATATRTVTVNGVSASAPFTATAPALPVTLTAGQTISVPVSFAPTAPGSFTGTVKFAVTDGGLAQTVGVALQGSAVQPGFTASPATLDFGQISVGSTKSLTASITNTGSTNETVSAVSAPSAPFTVTGLPADGAVLAPGQAVAVSVTFTPTAAAGSSSTLKISSAHGDATVAVKGTGVTGHAELSISPAGLSFGAVPVGMSVTQTLTVSNTGNLPVTVTKAAPPALPFVVNTPLPEGQVLNPEDTIEIQVTFAPTVAGTFNGLYVISSDDGNGAHNVPVSGTAENPSGGSPLPSPLSGGWTLNGTANMSGSDLVLTPATGSVAGSAVYSAPLPGNGLTASFTAQIGGGSGADGMTFALLDASGTSPQSLGVAGGGLGFMGLPGIAVTLDTYRTGNEPSSNFLGLATGSSNGAFIYAATTTNIPDLRSGAHTIKVTVTGSTVAVAMDGTQRLVADNVNVPPSALAAFTAATGGYTDRHAVSNVSISSGGTALPQPGTGWRYNGAAALNGAQVVLTPAQRNVAGSVLYSDAVKTDGLTASFTLSINGGTGADGATFALLDPTKANATSLGGLGGGLGFSGLAATAVTFVTYPQSGIDSNNFVGVATSTQGGTSTFVSTNTNVPDLRAKTHNVVVRVSGTTITVALDGAQVLNTQVPALTPTAIVGFTAGTGGSTDVHAITNAQILTGGTKVAPPPGGWTQNGSATAGSGSLTLTTATNEQTGSSIYNTPVVTSRLRAKFTIQIGGGTGADGQTFMLLDATKTGPTALGAGGGGLGFSGLPGVAVAFVTYAQVGDPSSNFVGISTTGNGRALSYLATSSNIPNLRTGTHAVEVVSSSSGGGVSVSIDGVKVLETQVAVPANAYVGFSGATGGATDNHAVSDIDIVY